MTSKRSSNIASVHFQQHTNIDIVRYDIRQFHTFRQIKRHFKRLGQTGVQWVNCEPSHAYLPHRPHDGELLCGDEGLEHDPHGHVHIFLVHVVSQVHLGVRLCHTDHRLDMTHSDGDAICRLQKMKTF